MNAFLVIPLLLGGCELGALLVMTSDSSALDSNVQQLYHTLALQLAQVLYAKICSDEVSAIPEISNHRWIPGGFV